MYISKIRIKNFRSIKDLEFEPKELCTIVGPNSAGKTNILKAIDLVLGEGWTTKAKVAKELFFDVMEPVEIEIWFREALKYEYYTNYKGNQTGNVNSLKLILNLLPELSATTTINNGMTFYGQEEFKKSFHFIYLPANRNLQSEMRVSEWTMLGKLMKKIHENYIIHKGSDEVLKSDFKAKMKEAKDFLEADFNDSVTFKKFNDTLLEFCEQNSYGLANKFSPNLNIYNVNQFYKTLQIQIEENSFSDKIFDAEHLGAGMQNLIMLSIFQTYAKLNSGNVIFGIEEPEIYLYPNAQRGLYKSFVELSKYSQIFYTTHGQNFVNAERAYEIEVVNKNKEVGTYTTKKNKLLNQTEAEKQKFKIYTHFNTERNELFFAKKIVLVEGDSDKILFITLCEEKWNIDLNKEGITFIECGGKGGVIYFIGICKLLGLSNYFAIWDKDVNNELDDKYNCLSDATSLGIGLEFDPDLETDLSINKGDKVSEAYNWAANIDAAKIPLKLNPLKDFLIKNGGQNEISPPF